MANLGPAAGGTPDRVWINYDYTAVNTTQDLFHADAAEAVARANSGDTIVLYDLESDPGETTDVAAANPEIVADMRRIMDAEHIPSEAFPLPTIDVAVESTP